MESHKTPFPKEMEGKGSAPGNGCSLSPQTLPKLYGKHRPRKYSTPTTTLDTSALLLLHILRCINKLVNYMCSTVWSSVRPGGMTHPSLFADGEGELIAVFPRVVLHFVWFAFYFFFQRKAFLRCGRSKMRERKKNETFKIVSISKQICYAFF